MQKTIIEQDYKKVKSLLIACFKGMINLIPHLFRVVLSVFVSVFIIKGLDIKETKLFYGWVSVELLFFALLFYFSFWLFHKTYWVEKNLKK